MSSCEQLIRDDLKNFTPYASARRTAGYAKVLLNANESAQANRLYPKLYRYPDQQPEEAKALLADFYQVKNNEILISRGSDEAIELLIRLFCEPKKDAIMLCPPTFGMYEITASLQAVESITVPLDNENFALDVEGILSAWKPNIKLLFLCSPNNPTGNLIPSGDIQQLCDALKNRAIVIVDEAYIEYAKANSFTRFINDYDNLVILRTLSKAFGLAGARCGSALSNATIIQKLLAIMAPYPTPKMLIDVIENSFQKNELTVLKNNIQSTQILRKELAIRLRQFSFIQKIYPSEANFILVKLNHASDFLNHCAQYGILLRDMTNKPNLENTVRISIGNENDIKQLIDCMGEYND